ncbi:MAG: adenylate/guanylate cyclase domain-containing protein [Rhodospirillales bacterium]|nr:adenylate/guanylate cyclase domain-containing protein [Rhodospirillales bacterium]
MAFEIFKKEVAVIEEAKALLEGGGIKDKETRGHFEKLLRDYEKLFKSTKKLVRLSDRSEAELNKLAGSLDEKNKTLEGLSTKLSKYLSPQVYESIFSGGTEVQLSTERKKLTVFFSDIKDFTQTTEDLQAEDLTYLLNKYLTEMSNIALEYGATIDKYIGDAMLMFFGDPETKGVKEDAIACIKMAAAMQRRMKDLQDTWRQKGYEKPFSMRIGINTGYCNVGNFGSAARMDYTIIGGEVNLAARLEGQCDPDGVLMSYETYALVREFVEAEERPPIHVKGIRKEVRPFAITNIFDSHEAERRVIREDREGMVFFVDMDKVGEGERKQTVENIEAALKEIKGKWKV